MTENPPAAPKKMGDAEKLNADRLAGIKTYAAKHKAELHPDLKQLDTDRFNRICVRLFNTGLQVSETGELFIGRYPQGKIFEDLHGQQAVTFLRQDLQEIVPEMLRQQEYERKEAALSASSAVHFGDKVTVATMAEHKRVLTDLGLESAYLPASGKAVDPFGIDGDVLEYFARGGFKQPGKTSPVPGKR